MPFFALDLEPRKIHHQTEEDQDCSNAFHLSFAARETQVKCLHDLTAEKDENVCLLFWSRNQRPFQSPTTFTGCSLAAMHFWLSID